MRMERRGGVTQFYRPVNQCWEEPGGKNVALRSGVMGAVWTRQVVTRLGLTLNEAKTSIKQARKESFNFLG
jgi:hypothetical protein